MSILVASDYDEPIYPWYDYAHDASMEHGLANADEDPPTVWDPSSVYGCTQDDWWRVLNIEIEKGKDGMYGRPIKPGVSAQFRRLHNRGMPIYVVTARGMVGSMASAIKDLTLAQVENELPFVTDVIFAKNKEAALRKLGADYFLDDRLDYYHQARRAGAMSYLLDERWNQGPAMETMVHPPTRLYSTRAYVDRIIEREDP